MPSAVAGILIRAFGRSTVEASDRAASTVRRVSCASRGSTSIDTRPSTWSVASYTGMNTSQAERTSSVVISNTVVSTSAPRAASARTWSS